MVAFVDPRTKQIIECNEILADVLGYKKTTLIGRSVADLHHESCRGSVKKVYNSFLNSKRVPEADLQLKKKRGGTLPVSLRLSGSEDEMGEVRCTRFSWHNITIQKKIQDSLVQEKQLLKKHLGSRTTDLRHVKKKVHKEEQKRKTAEAKTATANMFLRRQRNQLQQLAGQLISIQENERRRLARDLHDDTCQKLGMLAFQVESFEQNLPTSPRAIQSELQSLHAKITALANDIRSLSHQLHPAILDYLGLVKALEAFLQDFVQRESLRTELNHKNIPNNLPPNITNCLYRVTQESLGNSVKHGKATKVVISLEGFSKSLRLSIQDNGVGLTKSQMVSFKQGLGFISMQERLRLVKGKLTVHTKPKLGMKLVVSIPYTKSHI